jgi:aconitase B
LYFSFGQISSSLKKDIIARLLSYLKCFLQPEHQQLIVDSGALTHLVDLLKRHTNGLTSRAVNSLIRRAADAVTNLAHENSNIKTHVRFASSCTTIYLYLIWIFCSQYNMDLLCRMEGGIPPLVHLLEFSDTKVQRAAAGALRTLAFKNDENKNQVGGGHC